MKLSRALASFAFAMLLGGSPVAAEPLGLALDLPPVLRDQVIVNGDVVRLSDIFDGVDLAADPIVAYAPAPGRRAVFDANWLARVAARNELPWRPTSRLDRVLVERATITLGPDELTEILRAEPAIQQLGDQVEVVLANRNARIFLAADDPGDVRIESLSVDSENGRFRATLALPGDAAGRAARVDLSGRIHPIMRVPVPRATLRPGQVIGENDITWTTVRTASVRDNVVTGLDQLIGRTPRRPLNPEVPVRLTDLMIQDAVNRGTAVTIVFETPALLLTVAGRALDSGARGDVIRVQNLQSGRTIDAEVISPDQVAVFAANQTTRRQLAQTTDRGVNQ